MPVGRLGDAAAFSFYATKTMTTGGEGGMLVTDDDALADRARVMRLHGISADAWNRYGSGGSWAYEVVEAGFKYNLTDLAAAIGLVQLERLDEMADARAAIALRYDAAFASSTLLEIPPRRDGDQHAWHLYVVRLALEELSIDRAEVIRRLGEAGIGTSVHFIPLHLHPHYQVRYGYKPGDFPVAERIFERSISLPIWPGMTTVTGRPDREVLSRRWPARWRSSTEFTVGRCFGCAVQRRWYRTGRIRCAASSASPPSAATHSGQATAIGGTAAARTG